MGIEIRFWDFCLWGFSFLQGGIICMWGLRTPEEVARHNRRGQNRVHVSYYSPPEETVLVRDLLMCRWMMKTENAVACGAFP